MMGTKKTARKANASRQRQGSITEGGVIVVAQDEDGVPLPERTYRMPPGAPTAGTLASQGTRSEDTGHGRR
jgi:hypothetical protein